MSFLPSADFLFFFDLCFLCVIAMLISLGKRVPHTKACRMVVNSRLNTVRDEMMDNVTAKDCVIGCLILFEYLIVATAAPVIGNV